MIAYFLFSSSIGGATKSILEVVKTTKGDCIFLSNGPAIELFKEFSNVYILNAKGFSHTSMLWRKNLLLLPFDLLLITYSIFKTLNFLKTKKYKIAHINSSALIPQLIACKIKKIKTLTHIREPIANGYFGIRKKIITWLIKKLSDKVVAISKTDAKLFNAEVIYNPIYVEKACKNGEYVIMLGGVSKPKGTFELIKVAKLLPDINFVVVGNVPKDFFNGTGLKAFIKKHLWFLFYSGRCKKLKPSNVKFIGPIKDVVPLIKNAKVVVITNTISHFSRPMIEAYAHGKPVVAFDLPHNREVFIENTGFLVKPFDIVDFANKVKILYGKDIDESIREKMISYVKENFSVYKHIEKINKIYNELS
ncbi:MAG: glycosyltransferase [bacterium]|nr:glycosyltransferase [bacterium]